MSFLTILLFLPSYIGLLASVGDLTYEHINETSVNLSWTAPYTLDNVPITGYYINENSGRMLNTTDLSLLLSDVCDMTNVTVSAVNGAGIGQPASTSFYHERGILICLYLINLQSTIVTVTVCHTTHTGVDTVYRMKYLGQYGCDMWPCGDAEAWEQELSSFINS